MKWVVFILMLGLVNIVHAEMIEVPREELEEYLMRMEQDKELIESLQKENLNLKLQIQEYSIQINNLQQSSDNQIGIYMGGNISYIINKDFPIGANAIIMYKFNQWGIYAICGYTNAFNVGLGAMFKMR